MTHTPIPDYREQSEGALNLVTINKHNEERLLRLIDQLMQAGADIDQRFLSIARTHFEQGFMALNRSIMKPQRISLPGDVPAAKPVSPDATEVASAAPTRVKGNLPADVTEPTARTPIDDVRPVSKNVSPPTK